MNILYVLFIEYHKITFVLFYFFQSDDNASFLRAARGGNLEKVLEYLKANTDINTCNAVRSIHHFMYNTHQSKVQKNGHIPIF